MGPRGGRLHHQVHAPDVILMLRERLNVREHPTADRVS
jgi:hypothetical protein